MYVWTCVMALRIKVFDINKLNYRWKQTHMLVLACVLYLQKNAKVKACNVLLDPRRWLLSRCLGAFQRLILLWLFCG